MLQSTNHHTYIYKASISLVWEHSSDFTGVAKGSAAPAARVGKPGGRASVIRLASLVTSGSRPGF